MIPTVLHSMNITGNPDDLLYSGCQNGKGLVFVSLHDKTLDPLSCLKHAAHYLMYLLHRVREKIPDLPLSEAKKYFPLLALLEHDGGPDHNLTHFSIN